MVIKRYDVRTSLNVRTGPYTESEESYFATQITFGWRGKPILRDKWRSDFLYFTPLLMCQMCGFVSTPKKVHQRKSAARRKKTLCMGCWNTYKQRYLLEDNEYLIRKLGRMKYEQHNQNGGAASGVSVVCDGAGPER